MWLGVRPSFRPDCVTSRVSTKVLSAQANVMLSYPVDEAETLLQSKYSAAKESLANCEEDMDFLRQQITVCQKYTRL